MSARISFCIALLAVLLLASFPQTPLNAQLNAAPKNVILFYDDYPTRGDPEFQVDRTTVMPLIGHVDANGNPTDWMFDSFIFYSLDLFNDFKPSQAYIDSWISYIFDGGQIAKLDGTVAEVKGLLKQPDYQMYVFLTVPVAWDGVNFPVVSDVLRNVDGLMSRWQMLNPSNLRLVGFYWGFTENLYVKDKQGQTMGLESVVAEVAQYLHSKGLKLLMIPYLDVPSGTFERLHGLGVDYVAVQPNYAWDPNNDTTKFTTANEWVTNGYADGIEFEYPVTSVECCGGDWRISLRGYLDAAYSFKWNTNTIQAYYHGTSISLLGRGSAADYRADYELIYRYIVGTRPSCAVGQSLTLCVRRR